MTELEKRIVRAEELGQKWADYHTAWLQLDEAKKSVLADLMRDLDDGDTGEGKLERLARALPAFKEFLRNLSVAKGEELRAKVRYDAAVSFYEACRTAESTERVKMRILRDIP